MKRVLLISLMFFILFSCSKEQNEQTRELDINLKSLKSGLGNNKDLSVNIYPNPFSNWLELWISGQDSAQVMFRNDNGDKKKFIIKQYGVVMIDFSKEKSGTYYCEVLMNKTVFRTYLIKL